MGRKKTLEKKYKPKRKLFGFLSFDQMLCILTALKAESEPLINFFKLRKDSSFDFPVFSNNDIILVAIGVGGKNISRRVITVHNQFKRFNLIFNCWRKLEEF